MKQFKLALCVLFTLLLLPSCSSDDDIAIDTSVNPITLEGLMQVAGGGFYYCDWYDREGSLCLKKKHGEWYVAEPDFPAHESKPGDIGSDLRSDCLKVIDHYRVLVPDYFWFRGDKVYSDYSEMTYSYMGDDFKYADFQWSEDLESFFRYMYDQTEPVTSGRFVRDYYFFMRNELQIGDGNSLQMSFSNHPLRKHKDRSFNFILEGATAQTIAIRVEFDQSLFGCDGVRLVYKSSKEIPKYYQNFDSKEEAKEFIDSILAKLTDE